MDGNCKAGNECSSTSCNWNKKGVCTYDVYTDFQDHKKRLLSLVASIKYGQCVDRTYVSEAVIDEAKYFISLICELRGDIK